MIPASWRVETLTEGRIFFIEFYKRNRINFDCIEAIIEAVIYPWTGGLWSISSKDFQFVCNRNQDKGIENTWERTVSKRSVCLELIVP